MSGVLLAAAAALLLWPGHRAAGRLAPPGRVARFRPPRSPALPVAALAAAIGAVVSTPLVAALAGAAAGAGARALAARRAAARTGSAVRGLAEGLGALAAELRSGRSLADAAAAAGEACGDAEVGRSLVRAVRAPETVLAEAPGAGSSAAEPDELGDALARIAAGSRLSTRTGCSLAAVATAVEDDLRARRQHRGELRAATAGPRASAAVLAGLPLLGLLMGSGLGADPWAVLTTGMGQLLLIVGVALEAAGIAWSDRLVRRALR